MVTILHMQPLTRPVEGIANGSINRELAMLKRAFALAIQAGKLHAKPHIPMLKQNDARAGFFERDQYEAVLRHLPDALRPVIEVAYITGWRTASEILPLEWSRVDLKAGVISLDPGKTKNGEARTFPMTKDLRRIFEQLAVERDAMRKAGHITAHVFVRFLSAGRKGPKRPMPIKGFAKAWETACRKAGCPGRLVHDLRRTSIRNLVRAGVSERVAMTLSGHKTRSVFERYNITSPGDLTDAARRLDEVDTTTGRSKGVKA